MYLKLRWMLVLAFVMALMISDNSSKIFANEVLPQLELRILSRQGRRSTDTAIAGIAESRRAEHEKSDDIPGAGKTGKKDAATGDLPDEVQALKQRIIELQNKGKLGFRKIVRCRSVEGFGAYSPLEPGQPVSKIVFYCEPSNVNTMISGDRYVIDCAVDAFLMDSTGRLLIGKENIVKINRVSRSPVMDLYFKSTPVNCPQAK
jgi:hypothetical protein